MESSSMPSPIQSRRGEAPAFSKGKIRNTPPCVKAATRFAGAGAVAWPKDGPVKRKKIPASKIERRLQGDGRRFFICAYSSRGGGWESRVPAFAELFLQVNDAVARVHGKAAESHRTHTHQAIKQRLSSPGDHQSILLEAAAAPLEFQRQSLADGNPARNAVSLERRTRRLWQDRAGFFCKENKMIRTGIHEQT